MFGKADVTDLIGRKKYAKAIALMTAELDRGSRDTRLRMQLADVLVLEGRGREAVPVLIDLADEYASEGQAPKAIAVLKKIDKIEPGRRDVSVKLAGLIRKGRPGASSASARGYAPREGADKYGYEPAGAVFSEEHFGPAPVVSDEQRLARARSASWVASTHQEDGDPMFPMLAPTTPPPAPPPATPAPAMAAEPAIEVTPEPEEEVSGEALRGRVLDTIQAMLQATAPAAAPPPSAPAAAPVESPLFSGFTDEELVEVIQGLRLLTFEPGDIIVSEGDPGTSLFVVTTGTVKAFVRQEGGGQKLARTLGEGAFFGEISILSGKPRTATVTAAGRCELLELDRPTLDGITSTHPRVREVLEEFYIARASGDPV